MPDQRIKRREIAAAKRRAENHCPVSVEHRSRSRGFQRLLQRAPANLIKGGRLGTAEKRLRHSGRRARTRLLRRSRPSALGRRSPLFVPKTAGIGNARGVVCVAGQKMHAANRQAKPPNTYRLLAFYATQRLAKSLVWDRQGFFTRPHHLRPARRSSFAAALRLRLRRFATVSSMPWGA